ncbi:MAG: hypothetical protein ACOC3X_02560 [Nanoarchaeota archaeon]
MEGLFNSINIIVFFLTSYLCYLIYKNYKINSKTKKKTYEDYYSEILNSNAHKVKGKFES